jgi:hypothetical protein
LDEVIKVGVNIEAMTVGKLKMMLKARITI